jgi:hypothetical protein
MAQEPVFQHSRLQPFIDHPTDDTIRDSSVKNVSDHSDGWQEVCPFTVLELENGLVASGSVATSTAAPIEGCDWSGSRGRRSFTSA